MKPTQPSRVDALPVTTLGLSRRRLVVGTLAAACGAPPSPAATTRPTPTPNVPPARAPTARRLRLLTYNVLADERDLHERLPAMSKVIAQAEADVVALQEVTPTIRDRLLAQPWAADYHEATIGSAPALPNGQWILSRVRPTDARAQLLPGKQRRAVLYVDIPTEPGPITVATTHMESFLEDGPTRAAQLDRIFAGLADAPHAVLLGDLNFGDREEPETSRLPASYVDAWRRVHPDDPGLTWDIERSEMARLGSFVGEPSRRLDRILVRSPGWRPVAARIVGDAPLRPDRTLFPSDHFGLWADLEAAGSAGPDDR